MSMGVRAVIYKYRLETTGRGRQNTMAARKKHTGLDLACGMLAFREKRKSRQKKKKKLKLETATPIQRRELGEDCFYAVRGDGSSGAEIHWSSRAILTVTNVWLCDPFGEGPRLDELKIDLCTGRVVSPQLTGNTIYEATFRRDNDVWTKDLINLVGDVCFKGMDGMYIANGCKVKNLLSSTKSFAVNSVPKILAKIGPIIDDESFTLGVEVRNVRGLDSKFVYDCRVGECHEIPGLCLCDAIGEEFAPAECGISEVWTIRVRRGSDGERH